MIKYILLTVITIATLAADIIIKIYEKYKGKSRTEDKKRIYKGIYIAKKLFPNEEIEKDALEKMRYK